MLINGRREAKLGNLLNEDSTAAPKTAKASQLRVSFTGESQADAIDSGEKRLRSSVHEMLTRTSDPFEDKVVGYVAPRGMRPRGYHLIIREKPLKTSFIDNI